MTAKSDYLENAVLNHFLRNSSVSSPTTVYLALFTSDPGETGSSGEVSGGGYARQAISFSSPSGGVTSNSSVITFPTATGSWGTVAYFGIFDASTGGNMLYHGALTASKSVTTGDIVSVSVGGISVTET